jgi:integrase
MVERRHRERGEQSKARANLAMRYLRALFNFAAAKDQDDDGMPLIDSNPVKKLSQTRGWYRVGRRQTVIKPHELGAWVNAVLGLPNPAMRDYYLLVLLTGLWREEALSLTWERGDLTARTRQVIDPKNHHDHTLPLSDYLLDMLTRCRAAAEAELSEAESTEAASMEAKCVFTDSRGRRISNFRYTQAAVARASGVSFCIHDLRRTFATIAESLDISAYALKRLLNHKAQAAFHRFLNSQGQIIMPAAEDLRRRVSRRRMTGAPVAAQPASGVTGEVSSPARDRSVNCSLASTRASADASRVQAGTRTFCKT